jgi:hypothetical protein
MVSGENSRQWHVQQFARNAGLPLLMKFSYDLNMMPRSTS